VTSSPPSTHAFRAARGLLLELREDYATAIHQFAWPEPEEFNWAIDWFDVIAAEHPDRDALRVVTDTSDTRLTYGQLTARSDQLASWLRGLGVRRGDRLLLYFTSGTTAQPKLVQHTHVSYPVGHMSTMYWIGLQPGDAHLNISSPGWAKHAWSNVFAPWIAGAAALVLGHDRFSPQALFTAIGQCGVTTLCAPPTVWRMLVQADLASCETGGLRECISAGEPLNPEVIEQVRRAWGITVRDGYGQTETTAQIGNPPGQPDGELRAIRRDRARHPGVCQRATCPVQARSPAGVRGAAEDDLGKDPPS
jgi:acyl-coenzyme A synthetase/AMP-(fatty) acid ligase